MGKTKSGIYIPVFYLVLVVLFTGCATAPDRIDSLVTRLSSDHLWQNGEYPILGLPKSASTEQVVAKVFKMTGFDKGHVTKYKILKVREVRITGSLPDVYTAVLVSTDFGNKIVLIRYDGPNLGWWSRVYDTA
ncbi:MAG: hypothetical protein JW983_04750 [Elusimicrobia bacterium]|nr:hypothetical protein [Elusimicrobiota bacterium]